jgi:hypothetical protein
MCAEFGEDVAELVCSVARFLIASGCVTAVMEQPPLQSLCAALLVESLDLGLSLFDCDVVEVCASLCLSVLSSTLAPSSLHSPTPSLPHAPTSSLTRPLTTLMFAWYRVGECRSRAT